MATPKSNHKRGASLTKAEVFDACQAIKYPKEIAGEEKKKSKEPSYRDVLNFLGRGSQSTIGEYLNEWKAQDALVNATNIKPSESMLHSLQAEYTRVTTTLRQEFKTLLDEQTRQIGELQTLLEERDNELAAMKLQLASVETAKAEAEKQYIANLAEANTSQKVAKANETKLQQAFDALQKSYHTLDVEKTKIQTELELLKKREGSKRK